MARITPGVERPEMQPDDEPQPEQTDNRPRPEDGDQSEVDQKILAPGGSPQ